MNQFRSIDLGGDWRLCGTDLFHGLPEHYVASDTSLSPWMDARVPGDVRLDLIRSGELGDCNRGLEARGAQWVDQNIWIYRREFELRDKREGSRYFLVFENVDLSAKVYLNGAEAGCAENAFIRHRFEVTESVKEGRNSLAVVVESGHFCAIDKPARPYHWELFVPASKKAWLRKPQYVFGWDWNPKLISVGLPGPVSMEETASLAVADSGLSSEVFDDDSARLRLRLVLDSQVPQPATLRIHCPALSFTHSRELTIPGNVSSADEDFLLPKVERWWPIHFGRQVLYDFDFELSVGGLPVWSRRMTHGFRTVALDRSAHPESGEFFILRINDTPIFCRGANWVPSEAIHAAETERKYETLVELALEANFNFLRIWGGGVYAPESLLRRCDERGILVWHDFAFACSKYPLDDPDFLRSVHREVADVVRQRSRHPSLVVWCGNNEIEWLVSDGVFGKDHPWHDRALYHDDMPGIMERESLSQAYWPGSPYSEHCPDMQDKSQGDQHPWDVSMGRETVNFHAYRNDPSRFANEGGFLGAGLPATLEKYLGSHGMRMHSPEWLFHDNSENCRPDRLVTYASIKHWLGMAAESLPIEDYLYFSGLLQAEALQEFITNFRRRKFDSAAAVFWMFNDSWPTTHSWSIVDYDLRRRLPFHPVRRTFNPVSVICAIDGDDVLVVGVNDTPEPWTGELQHGTFYSNLPECDDDQCPVTLAANSSSILAMHKAAATRLERAPGLGVFAVLRDEQGAITAQHRLFCTTFAAMPWRSPEIFVRRASGHIVLESDTFVWGLCLDPRGDSGLPDDLIDLLPGIPALVRWSSSAELPTKARVGNLSEGRGAWVAFHPIKDHGSQTNFHPDPAAWTP